MSGKGSAPRPKSVDDATFSSRWDQIFRKDAGAKDGPTIEGAKASASSELEANRNGGQGTAQDGRQAEGDAE